MSGISKIIQTATISVTGRILVGALCVLFGSAAQAAASCERTVTANVVAMDQPVLFNRLGASNVNGKIYALARDVVTLNDIPADPATGTPFIPAGTPVDAANLAGLEGNVMLRPDKRPRPLVLRIAAGDCLTVNFTNLLNPAANPFNPVGAPITVPIDDQVAERNASFHVSGLQWRNGSGDDGSFVGGNGDSTVAPGGSTTYQLYAPEEGAFIVRDMAATVGSDANQGSSSNLLFGQVIVEPKGARIYRGQTTEEELRLASMVRDPAASNCGARKLTAYGQPIVDYEALYPTANCNLREITAGADGIASTFAAADDVQFVAPGTAGLLADDVIVGPGPNGILESAPAFDSDDGEKITLGAGNDLGANMWAAEGKAGLPVLNMIDAANEIVHSEINGLIVGPDTDGSWRSVCADGAPGAPALDCPYPLESIGKRNPSLPNRIEPFRDFASVWHDEPAAAQAFPGFYKTDPVFRYVLAGVKDGFMINYGSGGIGSEIIANRLGVGPMHDCLTCAYEEFFLTSFTVGDPAQLADVSANMGLEAYLPGAVPPAGSLGPKASYVPYPDDPANVHHSYTGDFVKFRNTHVGAEQHVFHLHNHQWLYNPNDDNSNYLDAQGIGPGVGYTYEINYGGSGNRMKSSGDAIFHCHFYPHFAQGMWYMWRNHDVLETGTPLQASLVAPADPAFGTAQGDPAALGFHTAPWALENGSPLIVGTTPIDGVGDVAVRARALPDAEIVAGAPIPAIIPLPGKAMAPVPGTVHVVPNTLTKIASAFHATSPNATVPVGSLADVVDRDVHPGYPFWIAGIEDVVGQRPPTPPLDMVDEALAAALSDPNPTCLDGSMPDAMTGLCADGRAPKRPINKVIKTTTGDLQGFVTNLYEYLRPEQAAGFDGGLPRTALQGKAAGGVAVSTESPIDFSKVLIKAKGVFYPEEGTDIEQLAMAYHATRQHSSYKLTIPAAGAVGPVTASAADFILNGVKPAVGAPYHEPCIDDQGDRFDTLSSPLDEGYPGRNFWGADYDEFLNADEFVGGAEDFDADNPRIYQGANIQFDAVLNKAGYHYPQQRIITLWEDAVPVITKAQAPEPMVLRFNSFECGVYHHTNLVPEYYELDDYQVRTPTDIIGQHIHLPKWDLTTADGAANGWNYEDGTLSPGAVHERIEAMNNFVVGGGQHVIAKGADIADPTFAVPDEFSTGTAHALDHPYFGAQAPLGELYENWKGARTTTQRWFFDPVINSDGIDRGLGLIFTHDHYGPSTHQQVGLYATVLAEPAKSTWAHNETGEQLGCRTPGERPAAYGAAGACRKDGGPASWQAMIIPSDEDTMFNEAGQIPPHREFYFEYSDFQHAYEAGVYVGADQNGVPTGTHGPITAAGLAPTTMAVENLGNPANCNDPANAFRCAINPPARQQKVPVFPDLVEEIAQTPAVLPGGAANPNNFCPQRPCPQAIDVQDPGMFAVNYRNEPVAMRVFDPNKPGPDGALGTQADGAAGDLAFALASVDENSNPIIRKFEVMDFGGASTLPPQNPATGGFQVLNIQPKAGNSIYGTVFPAPINDFTALKGGDPFTPMVRTMAGDVARIKMQAGGDEEEHTATVHGIKWLQGGSAFGGAPNSGWRNAQPAGISEQFTLKAPVIGVVGERGNSTDYVYSMDASQDGYWSGMWGLMRVYNNRQNNLPALPGSPWETTNNVNINRDGFIGVCPAITEGKGRNAVTRTANLRQYNVTAVLANDILPPGVVTMPPTDPNAGGHEGAYPDPTGGSLVYNSRGGGANGEVLHDPTAIMYVRTEDMVDPEDPTAGLKPGVPVEPLILRANAGDCIDVTLRNRLLTQATAGGQPVIDANGAAVFLDNGEPVFVADPAGLDLCGTTACTAVAAADFDQMPDMATYSELIGAVKRDRGAGLAGSTTFMTNLVQASPWVGIHAQLVEFDGSRDNGIHSGGKQPETLVAPGGERQYRWYAGHLGVSVAAGKGNKVEFVLEPTPVELGAANLQPADVIKQGMKSMVGQLVIEPQDATWPEDNRDGSTDTSATSELEDRAGVDPNGAGRKTRAMVTVSDTDGAPLFRDLSMVWAKGLTQYYGTTNQPVEHINGEGVGIPEDPQDDTGMAINYGIEPLWYRLGLAPNVEFGNAGAPGSFGGGGQANVFSNARAGGAEPQTPVFTATAGMETRMRIGVPHGTNRGSTFTLHGHLWQRDPYLARDRDAQGFPASGHFNGDGKWVDEGGIGSTEIGHNPMGFYMGGLESVWPSSHYDIRLPSAGGCANTDGENCVGTPGDYLYRDFGAIGSASGLWGILRVQPPAP